MRKAAAILGVLMVAGLAASMPSCWVHRKSDEVACNTTSDCKGGGTCENGYCLGSSNGCPGPCTSCDLEDRTCEIDCTASQPCGNLSCPAGFECTIECSNAGACGDIDCAAATGCDIDCSGALACHNINCGPGECSISCSGPQACPSIDCVSSCACDVKCLGSAACPSMSCPTVFGTGALCTRDGSAGARCDSSEADCDRCPPL
jgi:hypothetical protein